MRLLILGAEAASHHMLHVRLIAEEALRRGWEVALVTTGRSVEHPAGRAVVEQFGSRLPVSLIPEVGPERPGNRPLTDVADRREQLARFQEAARDARRAFRPDVVYFVDLDSTASAVGETPDPFDGLPWAGMLIRLTFHHGAVGVADPTPVRSWEEPLLRSLLRREDMLCLLTLDESLPVFAARAGVDPAGKLFWVPDTCDLVALPAREDARRRFGIPPGRDVVLIHGELTPRKNVHLAMEALSASERLSNVGLLLSGRQSPEVRESLQSPLAASLRGKGGLWEIDRFLVGAEQENSFAAADVAWLAYRDFYDMSAVLVQAGQAGLPVLACKQGLIAWVTARYELGPTIDSSNAREAASALEALVGDKEAARSFGRAGRKMAARHRRPGFGTCICNRLSHGSRTMTDTDRR